jgi:Rad3-related DNA helicase
LEGTPISNIFKHFPKGMVPRQVQRHVLSEVQRCWDTHDVIVIRASVASGKSACSYTIAKWRESLGEASQIVVPSNLLVNQYTESFPDVSVLKKMDSYRCTRSLDLTCKQQLLKKNLGMQCHDCVLKKARASVREGIGVCNTWIYQANRVYKPVTIFDEAHTLLPHLREYFAEHRWQFKTDYPSDLESYEQLASWFNENGYEEMMHRMGFDGRPKFLVEPKWKPYGRSKQMEHQLLFKPIDISDAKPILWPPKRVKKLILMSATISRKDIEYLGLNARRVAYIDASSPIAAEQRPVYFSPVANLSLDNQEEGVPLLAAKIKEMLRTKQDAGLIHATYGLAAKLRPLLADEPRLIWHTRDDKQRKYSEFRRRGPVDGSVLVGSGMYEGLDLAGDAGRWQIITKVPYPSLGDPVIRYLAEEDPEFYAWETIKLIVQAAGRICRTLDDFGETFIVDSSFERLYSSYQELFPKYFRDSLILNTGEVFSTT